MVKATAKHIDCKADPQKWKKTKEKKKKMKSHSTETKRNEKTHPDPHSHTYILHIWMEYASEIYLKNVSKATEGILEKDKKIKEKRNNTNISSWNRKEVNVR